MRKGGRWWTGLAVVRGDRARTKGKIEEKCDPRAFNPRKRNSSWIHFERKRALRGVQRIGVLFILTWWEESEAGVQRGDGFGVVDWKERGLSRIRPRDKGMTTVIRSSWLSQTSDPFLSPSLFFYLVTKKRTVEWKMRGCRYANRDGQLYIFGAFCLSRCPSFCVARSPRGKLLIRYNDEREPFDQSTMTFALLIADPKA